MKEERGAKSLSGGLWHFTQVYQTADIAKHSTESSSLLAAAPMTGVAPFSYNFEDLDLLDMSWLDKEEDWQALAHQTTQHNNLPLQTPHERQEVTVLDELKDQHATTMSQFLVLPGKVLVMNREEGGFPVSVISHLLPLGTSDLAVQSAVL